MPFRADDALVHLADNRLLVLRVKVTVVDDVFGDVPVRRNARAQQPAIFVLMIPGKTNRLALFGRQRLVQYFHERFRRIFGCGHVDSIFRLRPHSPGRQHSADRGRPQGNAARGGQELAALQTPCIVSTVAALTTHAGELGRFLNVIVGLGFHISPFS
jgi:hypothetical protein